MTALLELYDADIRPPVEFAGALTGATGGANGVVRIALTAGSVSADIPPYWRNRFVDFTCEAGTGMHIAFGNNSVALGDQATAVSTIAANVITTIATSGKYIPADQTRVFKIPGDPAITRFAWRGKTAAGFMEAVLSTGDTATPPANS